MEVRRKVIYMEERDVIQEARTMIKTLQINFSRDFTPSPDAVRLQEHLDYILRYLKKAERVDNRVLMELEKFYQRASFLIGLSALRLKEESFQAWRAYDRWHYEAVKSRLQVYGPSMIL